MEEVVHQLVSALPLIALDFAPQHSGAGKDQKWSFVSVQHRHGQRFQRLRFQFCHSTLSERTKIDSFD